MGIGRSLALAAVLVGAAVVATAATAAALDQPAAHTICTGYAACAASGHSDHGYDKHAASSYWSSAPGHNCTNYVAYVESSRGLTLPPGSYLGNATAWAAATRAVGITVDNTPTVGSVAQWVASPERHSEYGHVAIVEQVSADAIVVSSDSWGGDFHWTSIARSSALYPQAFIHFDA